MSLSALTKKAWQRKGKSLSPDSLPERTPDIDEERDQPEDSKSGFREESRDSYPVDRDYEVVKEKVPKRKKKKAGRKKSGRAAKKGQVVKTIITVVEGRAIDERQPSRLWDGVSDSEEDENEDSENPDDDGTEKKVPRSNRRYKLAKQDNTIGAHRRNAKVEPSGTQDTTDGPELDGCVARYDNIFNGFFEITSIVGLDTPGGDQEGHSRHSRRDSGSTGCHVFDLLGDIDSSDASSYEEERRGRAHRGHRARRTRKRRTRKKTEDSDFDWDEFFSVF